MVEAYNSQSKSTGFSQSKSLPLSEQGQHAKGRTLRGFRTRERFSERLMDTKSTHTNRVLWGTQYQELSARKSVMQLAWKNAQNVLVASIVLGVVGKVTIIPGKTLCICKQRVLSWKACGIVKISCSEEDG